MYVVCVGLIERCQHHKFIFGLTMEPTIHLQNIHLHLHKISFFKQILSFLGKVQGLQVYKLHIWCSNMYVVCVGLINSVVNTTNSYLGSEWSNYMGTLKIQIANAYISHFQHFLITISSKYIARMKEHPNLPLEPTCTQPPCTSKNSKIIKNHQNIIEQ